MSVLDIFRRKARATAKQLAPDAIRLAQSNQDMAFDAAVRFAAAKVGIDVDATEVRIATAAVRLAIVRDELARESARHEAAMLRIKERSRK